MRTIITYSEVNAELETTYSPNYRCACKKNAIDGGGKNIYGTDAQFPQNRLIWDVEKNTTSYTVTWVFNDGVTPDKVETNVPQGTSVDSATAGKPSTDPTRTGYDFAGWYIGNDLLDDQTVSGNITVTAHWTPVTPTTYTVTWDFNDGGTTPASVKYNVPQGTSIDSSAAGKPSTTPTYTGYTFDGWYIENTPLTNQTVSGNVTVTAHWIAIPYTYTITFVDYDDTVISTNSNYTYGEVITAPADPTRPSDDSHDYIFSGWFSTDQDQRQFRHYTEVRGDETFKARYGSDDRNDGNVKIFDNIGQLAAYSPIKTTPASSSTGDIGRYWTDSNSGWYSMVHDGHGSSENNADVLGGDKGISPSETIRRNVHSSSPARKELILDGIKYHSYVGDSIVYNAKDTNNNLIFQLSQYNSSTPTVSSFKTSDSNVTSSDLLSEVTFKNGNDVTLHIKSLASWIKFAIIDQRGNTTNTTFVDMAQYNPNTYNSATDRVSVNDIPLQAEIVYYIADNTESGNKGRCGKVLVEAPQGGKCTEVVGVLPSQQGAPAVFSNSNNDYMKEGHVYFYQLGENYTTT